MRNVFESKERSRDLLVAMFRKVAARQKQL